MLFILFYVMTVITSISDRPKVSLVRIWKSIIKKLSSFAKKKIQLCGSTHAWLTIQLDGIILKLSIRINIATSALFGSLAYHFHLHSLDSDDDGLLPDTYFHLISEHRKGPLVAVVRSPLMKALDRSVKTLGLWIVTSRLHSFNL